MIIHPPNLDEYHGFLVITPQDPSECDNESCRSANIVTSGILSTCNECSCKWTTPATITAWPKFLRTAEGMINNPVTTEAIELFITKYSKRARFWKFVQYDEIPQDRTFRAAMKCDADGFGHHLEAAKFVAERELKALNKPFDSVKNATTIEELTELLK